MSVITQDGDSALMMAVRKGRTEVVSLLVNAGATLDPHWEEASSTLWIATEMKQLIYKGSIVSSHFRTLV